MKKYKVILIGAGNRGMMYTDKMLELKDKFEVVAVADPIDNHRNYVKEKHNLSDEMCFKTWEPLLDKEKFADVVIVSTMDQDHIEPLRAAIKKGYNILAEKPYVTRAKECVEIDELAKKHNVKIMVCHVLRFTDHYRKMKEIINSGRIGDVVSIDHQECVGNIHQSHSFVRGNWGNSETSAPMILAKSCHDMDIIQWLVGKKFKKIQSFGSISYFKKENAPEGAPEYCIEGCPYGEECFYNAVKLYYDDKENHWFRDASTNKVNPTDEEVENAIRTTQYGKCVFKCDNNVVDHQTVNILFEDGVTAAFSMNAFNKGGRPTTIFGTKGTLKGSLGDKELELYDFKTKEIEMVKVSDVDRDDTILGGHGGGDMGIVKCLYDYLSDLVDKKDVSEITISCENHMAAFAAEESRVNDGATVDYNEYVKKIRESL